MEFEFAEGKGQMYKGVGTWNPLAGACNHACDYCYVKSLNRTPLLKEKYSGPLRLDANAMSKNLGRGNKIFVCSCNDLFSNSVENSIITDILRRCSDFPHNQYIFHTKNPKKFAEFSKFYPKNSLFYVTAETDSELRDITKAPPPLQRLMDFSQFEAPATSKVISVEPVMKFDLELFLAAIMVVGPRMVSIGADSKGHHLPEPDAPELKLFIERLKKFTSVELKTNLKRLLNAESDRT